MRDLSRTSLRELGRATRAVPIVLKHQGCHGSQLVESASVASKVNCTPEALRLWMSPAERDPGLRSGPISDEQARMKALDREAHELLQAHRLQSVVFFCPDGARPSTHQARLPA